MQQSSNFFSNNRKKLMNSIEVDVVILSGNSAMQRVSDMAYSFEQESNFWWLTGIQEPDWMIVLDVKNNKSFAARPQKSEVERIFEGEKTNKQIINISGVDEVITETDFNNMLIKYQNNDVKVATLEPRKDRHFSFFINPAEEKMYLKLQQLFDNNLVDIRKNMIKLRAIKSQNEITTIKNVVDITTNVLESVKASINDYEYEYQIDADITSGFMHQNAIHGYDPIVASGKNACTLHYTENSSAMDKNCFVLLDVGAKKNGYSADISRSFLRGEISPENKKIFEKLQDAHFKIIDLLRPDLPIKDYLVRVEEIMRKSVLDTGLISSLDDRKYDLYFPHAISHGLGVDVHDSLAGFEAFKEGMVLTVEPGIYAPDINLGLRIEDNILITKNGNENLSKKLSTNFD